MPNPPRLRPDACPLAVARMFDKNATLADLSAAGLPTPAFLAPEQLAERPLSLLDHRRWPVAYLKLNTGASAVGIVACRFTAHGWAGTTTLLRRGEQFFSTRRLRMVTGEELAACVSFLLAEGISVQQGLPHARLDGQNADLRVVCVGGKPVATIFRLTGHLKTGLDGRQGGRVLERDEPQAVFDRPDG